MSMPARAVQLGMPGAMSTSAAIRLYDSPARGERVQAQARGCKLALYFENAHAFIGDILSWYVNGVMSMYSMFGSRLIQHVWVQAQAQAQVQVKTRVGARRQVHA